MTIDLNTATTEEILGEFKTGIAGLTETLGIVAQAIDLGLCDADSEADVLNLVKGFGDTLGIVASFPEEILDAIESSPGFEVIEAARLVIALHEQAVAAGRKSTVRSIGLALCSLAIEITRRDAAAGSVDAQEALAKYGDDLTELGL